MCLLVRCPVLAGEAVHKILFSVIIDAFWPEGGKSWLIVLGAAVISLCLRPLCNQELGHHTAKLFHRDGSCLESPPPPMLFLASILGFSPLKGPSYVLGLLRRQSHCEIWLLPLKYASGTQVSKAAVWLIGPPSWTA